MRSHLILMILSTMMAACQAATDRSTPANSIAMINAAATPDIGQAEESEWQLSDQTIWYEVKCRMRHGEGPGRR